MHYVHVRERYRELEQHVRLLVIIPYVKVRTPSILNFYSRVFEVRFLGRFVDSNSENNLKQGMYNILVFLVYQREVT